MNCVVLMHSIQIQLSKDTISNQNIKGSSNTLLLAVVSTRWSLPFPLTLHFDVEQHGICCDTTQAEE